MSAKSRQVDELYAEKRGLETKVENLEKELKKAKKENSSLKEELKLAHKAIKDGLDTSDSSESACLGDLVPDPKYKSFQLAMEDQIRLQQGLAQLEDRTRKVLEFVFLQDLTQKEAAEIMGVSVITVSRRIKKGLSSLKQILGSNDEE